jgi:hypothetical protein
LGSEAEREKVVAVMVLYYGQEKKVLSFNVHLREGEKGKKKKKRECGL